MITDIITITATAKALPLYDYSHNQSNAEVPWRGSVHKT